MMIKPSVLKEAILYLDNGNIVKAKKLLEEEYNRHNYQNTVKMREYRKKRE